MIEDNKARTGIMASGMREAKKRPIDSYPVYKIKEVGTENEYTRCVA